MAANVDGDKKASNTLPDRKMTGIGPGVRQHDDN
jgi:hypothetical protein